MRTIGMIPHKEAENTTHTQYDELKKSELIEICEEKGIELTSADKRSKSTLIKALEAED